MGRPTWEYSRWNGNQHVPDLTSSLLLRLLRDDYLFDGDLPAALRRLLLSGFLDGSGRQVLGLAAIRQRFKQRRLQILQSHSLDHLFAEVEEDLQCLIGVERAATERRGGRSSEDLVLLDLLPTDVAGRVLALNEHTFVSEDASARFEKVLARIRARVLSTLLPLESAGSMIDRRELIEFCQGLTELALNEVANAAAQRFFERFGGYLPKHVDSVTAVLAYLRSRVHAAASLLVSMDTESADRLRRLLDATLHDVDLEWVIAQLASVLRDTAIGSIGVPALVYDFVGCDTLGFDTALELLAELEQLSKLENMLGDAQSPALLAELDLVLIEQLFGGDIAWSLASLRAVQAMLMDDHYAELSEGRLVLTPRAQRALGRAVLEECFQDLAPRRIGDHGLRQSGHGLELTGDSRLYTDGDLRLDVASTLRNAIRAGEGVPVQLRRSDLATFETESLTAVATVVAIDLSLSMPMRDSFLHAKKIAVAIAELTRSRFPRDHFEVVGFSEVARRVALGHLAELSWDFVYGTNIQAAVMLSRHLLARRRETRNLIIVTDGEPTAHFTTAGEVFFNYPPVPETVQLTLAEAMRCRREGIRTTFVLVDPTSYTREFGEKFVTLAGGRLLVAGRDDLLATVVADFSVWRGPYRS